VHHYVRAFTGACAGIYKVPDNVADIRGRSADSEFSLIIGR